ncbi:MAG: hypothetical protein PVJ61_06665 [Dehalococcoidia bacterium]|jgi:hypothetical protein
MRKKEPSVKYCAICGCQIHSGGNDYARPTPKGRSHATKHHFVAERFLGRSKNRKGELREPIFKNCPWKVERQSKEFCYDCHEELLHNPVLLPADMERFAKLVKMRGLNENRKTVSKTRIAGRIKLLHEVIETGIESLLHVAEHA